MNSESILSLKYFFASDLNTIGANGLKGSLSLIFKFKSRLIFGFKALATIDLFPRALGPNSLLPLKIAIILLLEIFWAINLYVFVICL